MGSASDLPLVRRYEAASFRAWPAASVHYDGTWVVRLDPGHPAKRLNSVNPLDPADVKNLDQRIVAVARRFDRVGRPLTFRMSPLSGRLLEGHLDSLGWATLSESLVMRCELERPAVADAMDQIPLKDVERFVNATLAVHGDRASLGHGLARIIAAIPAEAGLFVLEAAEAPVATAICVHDGDLAGLFEIATLASERGNGFGRRIVLSALKWARLRGAKEAWLQVEADNLPAVKLYQAVGFQEIYRYHYRQPPAAPLAGHG